MESTNYSITLLFILLFYIVLLIVLNRAVLYKGLKIFKLEEEDLKLKLPLLIAGNVSVTISLFILAKSFVNFITYQTNNKDNLLTLFGICSIVLVINVLLLLVSYVLSKLICNVFIKLNNSWLLAIVWLTVSTLLIILTSELYNQITSTNAFTIY